MIFAVLFFLNLSDPNLADNCSLVNNLENIDETGKNVLYPEWLVMYHKFFINQLFFRCRF